MEYGFDKTIHGTLHLDVETRKGKVVSVWFRCLGLPFEQHEVDKFRAQEMERMSKEVNEKIEIHAITIKRPHIFWVIEKHVSCTNMAYVGQTNTCGMPLFGSVLQNAQKFDTKEDAELSKTKFGLDTTWHVTEHTILED